MNEHEHSDLLKRLDSLNLDVPPMPEGFHEGWTARLEDEEPMKPGKFSRTTLIRVLSAAAALVFVVGGATLAQRDGEKNAIRAAGQASNNAMTRGYAADTAFPMEVPAEAEEYEWDDTADYGVVNGYATTAMKAAPERMMIRRASLTIGTQRYDESFAALMNLCEAAGGWTASNSENTNGAGMRTAYLTLRVPAEQLDGFLSGADGLGRITYRSESADDVTESYQDTRARLETQQALMARLQAMVTDAASLSDLLELESKIAETQYQLDRLQSSLNSTERQVNYATVDITLREENAAADITDGEKSLGERLGSAIVSGGAAFLRMLESAAVFLAAALPFIGIVAAVWLLVAVIRRALRKRR